MADVLIVLDEDFGERLREHAGEVVWIRESAANRRACEEAWQRGVVGLTCFRGCRDAGESLREVMADVVLHHAGVTGYRVIGLPEDVDMDGFVEIGRDGDVRIYREP